MSIISPIKFDTLVNEAVDTLPKRTKIVVARRFGLKNGKRETLEAIGRDYDITRERVRQIENDALRQLSREEVLSQLSPAFTYLEDHFKEYGNVRAEEKILEHLSGEAHPHPRRQAILFVLTLGDKFVHESESDAYHAHWVTDEASRRKMTDMVTHLIAKLQETQYRTWEEEELLNAAKAYVGMDDRTARSYLEISKEIGSNVFGQFGLTQWPEITPAGVRDKAYLVMRREGKPLHFSGITERINQAKFSDRKAYVQTVHNELIKDKRFVLVGRGLYALSEWGYTPGTVRDVLAEVLKEKGPLTKEEVVEETLKRRMVRPNTIVLNLQNPKFFIRVEGGKYALANS
ncbi:MAG: sigma factor-like helix-turn-helix DNA-binding protein [bacterium]|nr:sigma factor-like helix-turn-helix DNA-binding protein [bacterium]